VAAALLAAGANLLVLALLSLLKPVRHSGRWAVAAAVCLAADLVSAGWGLNPGAPADLYRAPTASGPAVAAALRDSGRRLYQFPDDEYEVRFDPYFSFQSYGPSELARGAREAQLPNVGVLDRLASAGNFDPLVSARYAAWTEVVSQTRSTTLLNAAGIAVLASRAPLPWEQEAQGDTVGFYRVPGEARRAWVVYAARSVAGPAEARAALADPAFDPWREVILEAGDPAPPAAGAPPAFDPADPNQVQVRVTLERAGWLVLADTFYPGWQAWADGRPAAIRPANLAFRAVALPAGEHTVRFHYRPDTFAWGARLSLAGLSLWAIGLLGALRRRREPPPVGRSNTGGEGLTGR
jgi:hypothetical protein